jgi:hypothetical protein
VRAEDEGGSEVWQGRQRGEEELESVRRGELERDEERRRWQEWIGLWREGRIEREERAAAERSTTYRQ